MLHEYGIYIPNNHQMTDDEITKIIKIYKICNILEWVIWMKKLFKNTLIMRMDFI